MDLMNSLGQGFKVSLMPSASVRKFENKFSC
ncbi:unnamed protein product [Spirodela intermedia]|uniref:Uncharacterized protein n=1 Tax=Spirodela intermedia TaxID=51605 RepID=A0ABN7EA50_SPIIN|nr:unnamed protein product [Spirodela intermedia]